MTMTTTIESKRIQQYPLILKESLQYEHEGEVLRSSHNSHQFQPAKRAFQKCIALEEPILGSSHAVIQHLQDQIHRTDLLLLQHEQRELQRQQQQALSVNVNVDADNEKMSPTPTPTATTSLEALQAKCQRLEQELQAQQKIPTPRGDPFLPQTGAGGVVSSQDNQNNHVIEQLQTYKFRAEQAETKVQQLEMAIQELQTDNRKLQDHLAVEESVHSQPADHPDSEDCSMHSRSQNSPTRNHANVNVISTTNKINNNNSSSNSSHDDSVSLLAMDSEDSQDVRALNMNSSSNSNDERAAIMAASHNKNPTILMEQLAEKAQELKDFLAEASSIEIDLEQYSTTHHDDDEADYHEMDSKDGEVLFSQDTSHGQNVEKDFTAHASRVKWLERQCATLEETVVAHETMIEALHTTSDTQQDLLEQAQTLADEKEHKVHALQSQVQHLLQTQQTKQQTLEKSRANAKELQKELSGLYVQIKELKDQPPASSANNSSSSGSARSQAPQQTASASAFEYTVSPQPLQPNKKDAHSTHTRDTLLHLPQDSSNHPKPLDRLEQDYNKVESQLLAANQQVWTLQESKESLQSQLSKVESSCQKYQEQFETSQAKHAHMMEEYQETQQRLEQVELAKTKVKQLHEEAQEVQVQQRTELQQQSEKQDDLHAALQASRQQLEHWKQQQESQQLSHLQTQCSREELLKESQEQVTQLESRLETSTAQVQALQEEQTKNTATINELEAIKVEMDLDLFKARERITALESDNVANLDKFSKLEKRQFQVDAQLQTSEQAIAQLTAELETCKGQVDYLDFSKAEMEERLETANEKIANLSGEKESVEAQYDELKSIHEQTESRLVESIKRKKMLDALTKSLQSEVTNVTTSKYNLDVKLDELRVHSECLSAQLEESREQAESQRLLVAQADTVNQKMRHELDQAESNLRNVESQSKVVKHESEQLRDVKQELEVRLDRLLSEKMVLQSALREAENAVSLSSIDKKSLHADKAQLESKKAGLEEEFAKAQKDGARWKEEVGLLAQQLQETRLSSPPGRETSDHAEEPHSQISNKELLEIKHKKTELEDKLRASEVGLDLLRRELATSNTRLNDYESTKEQVDDLLKDAKATNLKLEQRLKSAEAAVAAMNEVRKMSERKLLLKQHALEQEGQELNSRVEQLQDDLALRESPSIAAMLDEIKSLLHEKSKLAHSVSKLKDEKSGLGFQLTETTKAKEMLAKEKVSWDMRISELDIANIALKTKVTGLMRKVDSITTERGVLQTQLDITVAEMGEVEHERMSLSTKLAQSERGLKEARRHLKSLIDSLKTKEAESRLLGETGEALKSLQIERESLSLQVEDLESSKSMLGSRLQESLDESKQLQEELNSSSSKIFLLESLKEDSEKQKREKALQIEVLKSKKSTIDARVQETENKLKIIEVERDAMSVFLNESRNETTEATRQLDEYIKLVAQKEVAIERLERLVNEEETTNSKASGVSVVVSPEKKSMSLTIEYEQALQKSEQRISELEQQIEALQKNESSDDTTVSKLKSQNQRAVQTIKGLSKELLALDQRYHKVAGKHAKLKQLFKALESKSKVLKDQCHLLERRSTEEKVAAANELDQLKQTIDTLKEESKISTQDTQNEKRSLRQGLSNHSHEIEVRFKKVVELSQYAYTSSTATYTIRRPFKVGMGSGDVFADLDFSLSEAYAASAHVRNPSSIQVAAIISHDGSHLCLSGLATVRHKRSDGIWNDLGDADTRDRPLGWIAYTKTDGNEGSYSLDEILEEARLYRQHYCESVMLDASSPDKGLRRVAKLTNSEYLEKLSYSPRAKTFSPFFEPQSLILLAAVSVAAMSISASKYYFSTDENEQSVGSD